MNTLQFGLMIWFHTASADVPFAPRNCEDAGRTPDSLRNRCVLRITFRFGYRLMMRSAHETA